MNAQMPHGSSVLFGNAEADGAPFNSWLVGDLKAWSQGADRAAAEFGLRQSSGVEIKWGVHATGERRTEWAACSERITISMLLRGRFLLTFRSPTNRGLTSERRLEREGDYAIWGTDVEHTWIVEENAVILTVRWRRHD